MDAAGALDPDTVHDRETFLAFVPAVVADREAAVKAEELKPTDPRVPRLVPGAGGWYNFTVEGYLDGARSWAEDSLPSGRHTLFAWGEPDSGVRAWRCPAAPAAVPAGAAPDHRILLGCLGGVVERFNEPSGNWLLNHNHAPTAAEVERDAPFMTAFAWAFEECGGIRATWSSGAA
ncbi:hypothetical protein [Gemmata sp.]|uniref:hypothetical protein n=1 Tax=Gemmata sp. TaxID=1914242 RepID=UPI003F706175